MRKISTRSFSRYSRKNLSVYSSARLFLGEINLVFIFCLNLCSKCLSKNFVSSNRLLSFSKLEKLTISCTSSCRNLSNMFLMPASHSKNCIFGFLIPFGERERSSGRISSAILSFSFCLLMKIFGFSLINILIPFF